MDQVITVQVIEAIQNFQEEDCNINSSSGPHTIKSLAELPLINSITIKNLSPYK